MIIPLQVHYEKGFLVITFLFLTLAFRAYSQCEADHLIILNNFEFVPSELTIAPGETVAFINIEGEHTLNGITNSISGEPFNNPLDIFLEQSTGNTDGFLHGNCQLRYIRSIQL